MRLSRCPLENLELSIKGISTRHRSQRYGMSVRRLLIAADLRDSIESDEFGILFDLYVVKADRSIDRYIATELCMRR